MKTLKLVNKTEDSDIIEIERTLSLPSVSLHKRDSSVSANYAPMIETRTSGEFAGRALYLDSAFDWVLGKDNENIVILVPVKKK